MGDRTCRECKWAKVLDDKFKYSPCQCPTMPKWMTHRPASGAPRKVNPIGNGCFLTAIPFTNCKTFEERTPSHE